MNAPDEIGGNPPDRKSWVTLSSSEHHAPDTPKLTAVLLNEQGAIRELVGPRRLALEGQHRHSALVRANARSNHRHSGSSGQTAMTRAVPVFVAAMVLIIRVLLINTFSIAGERIFTLAEDQPSQYSNRPVYRPSNESVRNTNSAFPRPAPKPASANYSQPLYNEPTYHPIGMTAQPRDNNPSVRR